MLTRPLLPPRTHPVHTGRYLLGTNEITKMYNTVSRWIECRSPGGIIFGRQRIGKTRAIRFLKEFLPNEFGTDLPVFLYLCQEYARPNELVFFEDLLRNVGHPLASTPPARAAIKRDRLYNFLIDKGLKTVEKRVILILDDAQRLQEQHYEWLMDIYNALDRANVELTILLVGQKELKIQKDLFVSTNKAQIVGRFMVHEHEFFGLKTVEDISACLEGFDYDSKYPDDSECSFTQYFFPEMFQEGFRLSNLSNDFYETFVNMRKENGFHEPLEVPMQYFTRSIEYILKTYGVEGENVEKLTQSHIQDAIRFTNYIEMEISASKLV
jgi:AAA domain